MFFKCSVCYFGQTVTRTESIKQTSVKFSSLKFHDRWESNYSMREKRRGDASSYFSLLLIERTLKYATLRPPLSIKICMQQALWRTIIIWQCYAMCSLFFSPPCWTDKRRPDAPSALHRIRVSAGVAGPSRELDRLAVKTYFRKYNTAQECYSRSWKHYPADRTHFAYFRNTLLLTVWNSFSEIIEISCQMLFLSSSRG